MYRDHRHIRKFSLENEKKAKCKETVREKCGEIIKLQSSTGSSGNKDSGGFSSKLSIGAEQQQPICRKTSPNFINEGIVPLCFLFDSSLSFDMGLFSP